MKKLSRFDLGMAIAFAVVALLGGAAWYYLSGQLANAQSDVAAAAGDFDKYSKQQVYLPTGSNAKTLQADIDVMTAQLDPLVKSKLQAPGNKLSSIQTIDTVEWKSKLDDEVRRLNTAAKLHGIVVPKNFYYGFSRYLNQNPAEEATDVLSRQQLAIEQIATIMIDAPVRGITGIRRTAEEDGGTPVTGNTNGMMSSDILPGTSIEATSGVYTAYPFEVEFDTTTEGFRKVVDGLMTNPYVFVIRGLTVQNSQTDSPKIRDLDRLAGSPSSGASVVNSSPGEVAAQQTQSAAVGPQFLFGGEILHVRARIDLIDWHGIADSTEAATTAGTGKGNGRNAGGRNGAHNSHGAAPNP